MAERLDRRGDEQLERALRAIGEQLAYPPTPDLARNVQARLAAGPPARRSALASWFAAPFVRRLAFALVLSIALVGAVLVLSPGVRNAVADRLGVPGIVIEYATPTAAVIQPSVTPTTANAPAGTPATPGTSTQPTTTPTPASVGERLGLGRRVTLEEARAAVSFTVVLPSDPSLGPPDEVYLGLPPLSGQVSLVWLPRPGLPEASTTGVGLLVTQFRAGIDGGFAKKIPSDKTIVRSVIVNGRSGYWIEGEPHNFFYDHPGGTIPERPRLAGNVLLWEQGGITYRIEGPRTLEEARRIAESLR
jgi:hypothetical protein